MRYVMIALLLFFPFIFWAQKPMGIDFVDTNDWSAIVRMAKAQNKYIFVDCFCTWCGPCKEMDQKVFSSNQVGAFYNRNYISVRLQFDSTGKVNDKWFPGAKAWIKEYGVVAYPTFLFFTADGELVNKYIGEVNSPEFLDMGMASVDSNRQYYTLLARFQRGDSSRSVVMGLTRQMLSLGDYNTARAVGDLFLRYCDSPFERKNLEVIASAINGPTSKTFAFLLANQKRVDTILVNGGSIQSLLIAILADDCRKRFVQDDQKTTNWDSVRLFMKEWATPIANRAFLMLRYQTAYTQKKYEEFGPLLLDYFDSSFASFSHNEKFFMNNQLFEMFNLCNNKKTLKRAAAWSKRTFDVNGSINPAAIDTYANLLYKAGYRHEALKYEKTAISIAKKYDDKSLEALLEGMLKKMENSQPTWSI